MLVAVSRGYPPGGGQVPYVLLTRAPVAGGRVAAPPLPLDLHVLGLSLAFILSQDQTLRCCLCCSFFFSLSAGRKPRCGAARRPRQREIPRPGALVRSVSFSFRTCPRIDADAGGGFPPRAAGKPRFRVARGRLVSVISSVASFQCPLPAPEGRDCKGNNFFPSPQAPKDLFSRAGTAVPRLRLQRYCRFAPQSKFFPNFFTKNFIYPCQTPVKQIYTTKSFFNCFSRFETKQTSLRTFSTKMPQLFLTQSHSQYSTLRNYIA